MEKYIISLKKKAYPEVSEIWRGFWVGMAEDFWYLEKSTGSFCHLFREKSISWEI